MHLLNIHSVLKTVVVGAEVSLGMCIQMWKRNKWESNLPEQKHVQLGREC